MWQPSSKIRRNLVGSIIATNFVLSILCMLDPFWLALLGKALELEPSRVSGNWAQVVLGISIFVISLAIQRWRLGWTQMKKKWAESIGVGVLSVAIGWMGLFCYSVYLEMKTICEQSARTKAPPLMKPPRAPEIKKQPPVVFPSFVFAWPAVEAIVPHAWIFLVSHRGDSKIESIDYQLTDILRREELKKIRPNGPIYPNEYSVFGHIDEMFPKGRGSIYAKHFFWTPAVFEHEQYEILLSGSTGTFLEKAFVERVGTLWKLAVSVEDLENKRIVLSCVDPQFPTTIKTGIVSGKKCVPGELNR